MVVIGVGLYITTGPHPSTLPCFETGFIGTLYVRVVADGTNQSVSGAKVTADISNYCGSDETIDMGVTNSTGYSSGWSWSANYTMSVVYVSTSYTFAVQVSGGVDIATLSVPSGVVVEITTGVGSNSTANSTTTVTAY